MRRALTCTTFAGVTWNVRPLRNSGTCTTFWLLELSEYVPVPPETLSGAVTLRGPRPVIGVSCGRLGPTALAQALAFVADFPFEVVPIDARTAEAAARVVGDAV